MGLDVVELIMQVEDTFQITIQDREAEGIRTVGDLYRLVGMKTNTIPQTGCFSAHVFYRLRRTIQSLQPGVPARLRPATPLTEALPLPVRRALWPRLAASSSLRLPELQMSSKGAGWLAVLGLGGAALIGVLTGCATVAALGMLAAFASLILWGVWQAHLNRRTGRHVRSCTTLGDLARLTMYRNFGAIAAQCCPGQHRELWNAVCSVVAECLEIRAGELRPETRFKEELNLG
ncbi:MAG: acyl carrier protein [Phycisphaerae bacterium]